MENPKWHHHVKHYFVPHEGNGFRPKVLRASVLGFILLLAVVLQGVYLFESRVLTKAPDFLAAVLPGILVSLTNEDRVDNGVGELEVDPLLVAAAQKKADDMAEKGYFAHVTPDGYEPWHFLQLVGYRFEAAGENLAVNFDDSEDVAKAWMNSPTHRENLLRPNYTHVGIAVAKGTYKGKDAIFVAQFFGRPAKAAPVATTPIASPEQPTPEPTPAPEGEPTPPVFIPSPPPVPDETIAPAEIVIATSGAPVASVGEDVVVLGEEVPSPLVTAAPATLFDDGNVTPTETITYILVALAVIVTCLLAIAVVAHMKLPYVEALGGTLVLLLIIVGLLTYDFSSVARVELPSDTQSASVILSL